MNRLRTYLPLALFSFFATVSVLGLAYAFQNPPPVWPILFGVCLVSALGIIPAVLLFPRILKKRLSDRRFRALTLSGVDEMGGIEFERYAARLLQHRGFQTVVTKASGDLGVDIIASNGAVRYAVQVKRWSRPVSRHAVSDAVGGMKRFGCNAAMVITNSTFSPDAIELAMANGCELVDREKLAKWIDEFQRRKL